MAIENQISVTFTAEELTTIDTALTSIEKILKNKCINLTPEQRMEFSRLGNRTENWSKKAIDYMSLKPLLVPAFVDVAETNRDNTARQVLMQRFRRIEAIHSCMDDTLMLLGSDIYQSCIAFYRNTKLLAQQHVLDAKPVYEDLSEQFPGKPSAKKAAASN